jgi:DNA-binding CsgD family transcriptional regulator
MSLGNHAAARGWLGRAESLVEDHDLGPLRGFVLVGRADLETRFGQPDQGALLAREALEIAKAVGDADLEICARAELGAALVELGRIEEGIPLLDEAMAAALAGEGGDLDTIVFVSCLTVTSCARGRDVKRVAQWVRAADDFNERFGSPHLFMTCRVEHGSILFAAGDWVGVERELSAALEIGRVAEPALRAEALSTLARLRMEQGRLEEAERLLAGHEDHPETAYAIAQVHLAAARPSVAATILRRRLRAVDERSPQACELLALLVEAELEVPDLPAARAVATRLADFADETRMQLASALSNRAMGDVLVAAGEAGRAVPHLEAALADFIGLGHSFDGVRTRWSLARALAASDKPTAIAEATTALAAFETMGAARLADETAGFLRSLGARAARAGPKGTGVLTNREREVLALLSEGLSNAEIAERLVISRRTAEHHVASVLTKLDLRSRGEATAYALRHPDPA